MHELFVRINGQQQYLWLPWIMMVMSLIFLLQSHRDRRAAEQSLRRLLRGQGKQTFRIITNKLKSYSAASRTICLVLPTRPNHMPIIAPRLRVSLLG